MKITFKSDKFIIILKKILMFFIVLGSASFPLLAIYYVKSNINGSEIIYSDDEFYLDSLKEAMAWHKNLYGDILISNSKMTSQKTYVLKDFNYMNSPNIKFELRITDKVGTEFSELIDYHYRKTTVEDQPVTWNFSFIVLGPENIYTRVYNKTNYKDWRMYGYLIDSNYQMIDEDLNFTDIILYGDISQIENLFDKLYMPEKVNVIKSSLVDIFIYLIVIDFFVFILYLCIKKAIRNNPHIQEKNFVFCFCLMVLCMISSIIYIVEPSITLKACLLMTLPFAAFIPFLFFNRKEVAYV